MQVQVAHSKEIPPGEKKFLHGVPAFFRGVPPEGGGGTKKNSREFFPPPPCINARIGYIICAVCGVPKVAEQETKSEVADKWAH